jgi:hypothetical protein
MYLIDTIIIIFLFYAFYSQHKRNKILNNMSDEVFEEVKSRVLIDFAKIFKSNIILPEDPLKKTAKDMQKTYDSYKGVGKAIITDDPPKPPTTRHIKDDEHYTFPVIGYHLEDYEKLHKIGTHGPEDTNWTQEELDEFQKMYDEIKTPVWVKDLTTGNVPEMRVFKNGKTPKDLPKVTPEMVDKIYEKIQKRLKNKR